MSSNNDYGLYTIALLLVMLIHMIIGFALEHKHFHYLHESGLGIFIGAIAGMIGFLYDDHIDLSFSRDLFFFVLVPVLFFAEAYSMQKRYFFKYFMYINCFGVLGTFINVNLIFGMTELINEFGGIKVEGQRIRLTKTEVIYFSIIVASLECLVGRTQVKQYYRPKLQSVLFGEELMNEVTVYSLFVSLVTVLDSEVEGVDYDIKTYFAFIGVALIQFVLSIVFGLLMGIIFTALSKYLVEMLKSEIAVSAYVLYVGYLSYSISKYLHLPGAVTIFVVGLIFSHYLSYNMPFKCFEASRTSLRFMASCFESFIFVYLGMTFAAMFLSARASEVSISWGFICYEIFVIIIARAVSFYGVIGIILLTGYKTLKTLKLNRYDFLIMYSSGLVRGSVAFALIQYLQSIAQSDEEFNKDTMSDLSIISSTIMLLIIGTNLLSGVLMPFIARYSFKRIEEVGMTEQTQEMKDQMKALENGKKRKKSKVDRKSQKLKVLFKTIDEQYIKPLMIYNYKARKDEIDGQRQQKNEKEVQQSLRKLRAGETHLSISTIFPTNSQQERAFSLDSNDLRNQSILSLPSGIELNPMTNEEI